jgi:hypothetical protein
VKPVATEGSLLNLKGGYDPARVGSGGNKEGVAGGAV